MVLHELFTKIHFSLFLSKKETKANSNRRFKLSRPGVVACSLVLSPNFVILLWATFFFLHCCKHTHLTAYVVYLLCFTCFIQNILKAVVLGFILCFSSKRALICMGCEVLSSFLPDAFLHFCTYSMFEQINNVLEM